MAQDLTIRIAAQNEALAELEKTRAQVVALMEQIQKGGARIQPVFHQTTEGLSSVRRGMEALAAQATGVEGPIGRIASGLLMFGTGGEVTIGAVAGIGLIAAAWKAASYEATHLAQSADDAAAAYKKLVDNAHTRAVQERAEIQAHLVEARQALATAREPAPQYRDLPAAARPRSLMPDPAKIQEAETAVHGWELALAQANVKVGDVTKGMRDAIEQTPFAQLVDSIESIRGSVEDLLPTLQQSLAVLTLPKFLTKPDEVLLGKLAAVTGAKVPILTKEPESAEQKIARAGAEPKQNVTAIVTAAMSAVGSLRGGVSGALSGAGGILSSIKGVNPLFGTVLSGLSALTGLFSSGGGVRVTISRLEEEALAQMKQVNQVPQNVSVVAVGGNGARETRYALGRSSSLDQTTRLPYG